MIHSSLLETSFMYTGNTPLVNGTSVIFDIAFGGGVVSARCALLLGTSLRVRQEFDCE